MDQLKVHIDSNLIRKTTSSIPDELKDLGVNVYNENEFEEGVMLQVNLQLAEYELSKLKERMKKIGVPEGDNDNESIDFEIEQTDNQNNEARTSDEIVNLKKRKNDKYQETIDKYKEKKLKLESQFQDYKNYLIKGNNNSRSAGAAVASEADSNDEEHDLVKLGEMTPFGTIIDFNKGVTKKKNVNLTPTTSLKQKKLTDFEAFLVESDKKPVQKPKVLEKSHSEVVVNRKSGSNSEDVTDFEKFLMNFDDSNTKLVNKKPKSSLKVNNLDVSNASVASNNTLTKKNVSNSNKILTDFDKYLLDFDDKTKIKPKIDKKKPNTNVNITKSKSQSSKPETKKISNTSENNANVNLNPKPSKEVISFIGAIEEDENEIEQAENSQKDDSLIKNSVSRLRRVRKSLEEIQLNDDEDSNCEAKIEDDDDEYVPDENEFKDDDEQEEGDDYAIKEEDNDDSDVEYSSSHSEDDEDNVDSEKLRKCNDDGDEDLFLKRLKKLDKQDKELMKNSNGDAEAEYVELDGGLRVPIRIWNRLYKFQKTGVKWLWELHLQHCGGILGGRCI